MSADVDNLILEHGRRLTALEIAVLGVRRDTANDAMSALLPT